MNRNILTSLLLLCLCGKGNLNAQVIWNPISARPASINLIHEFPADTKMYSTDNNTLQKVLAGATKNIKTKEITIPTPSGQLQTFNIVQNTVLPPTLAAKYPMLATYTGVATDNPAITAKIDYTIYGFHAMVYDGNNTYIIDPATNEASNTYAVYYKNAIDHDNNLISSCLTGIAAENHLHHTARTTATAQRITNGYELRRYRLAVSCTHQYAQVVTNKATPTKAEVLSKMTTTINRVNGIYERELSVTMTFANNEDALIFTTSATDPLGAYNSSPVGLMSQNQIMCDSLIGDANYDLGHAFSTGAGGLSQVGIVCKSGLKAQCVTGSETPYGDGFDVDYVAHEIGHEYGADHTFNNSLSSSCLGQGVQSNAYEPGSGSTIMAYAGICAPDNLQPNSDAYFHTSSLIQINNYLTTGGDACPVKSPTNNKPPGNVAFTASYTIPYRTPFELTAPMAADSTNNAIITYCWEQWNLGDFGKTLSGTSTGGPLFRSYLPTPSNTRTFPSLRLLRNGLQSNAGVNNASGEKLPDAARYLTFRLATRSLLNGYGTLSIPDDTIHLDVVNTGSNGFTVTSQNTADITYQGLTTQTVTWNTAGTNAAPISAANVDIYLSTDSGYTWPYLLGTYPNNGSAAVTLPDIDTTVTAARFKVKGTGNVFFNINGRDFKVVRNIDAAVKVYPVPASQTLHINTGSSAEMQAAVYNMVGRKEWEGVIIGNIDLPVHLWARGVYILKLTDTTKRIVIRKIVVD